MFCFKKRERDFEEKVLLLTSDKYRRTSIRKIQRSQYYLQIWITIVATVSLFLGITVAELCGVGKPYPENMDTSNMTQQEFVALVNDPCTPRASSGKALCFAFSLLLTGLVVRFYMLELSLVHLNSSNWREEKPNFWKITEWAMHGGIQSKKFVDLLMEIFLCIVNPVPGLSFQFLAQSYIFQRGQMVLNYRIENIIVVCMFPRLYHIWRLYRMWMFSKFFDQEFLRFMDNPTLNLFATIVPSNTAFAVKVALARYPVLTMTFSLFVFLWVSTYLMRLAEAPFQTDIAENIWNPMWMVVVTLATVGYGDTTPVTYTGRTIAVLVMIFGALYVAAVTATFCEHISMTSVERDLMIQIDMEQWQFKLACLAAAVIQNRWRGRKDKRLSFQFKAMQKKFIKWAEDEEVEVDRYVIKRTSTSKNNAVGDGGKSAEMIAARFDTLEQKLTTCQDEQLSFVKEQKEVFHNVEKSLKLLHSQILQMSSALQGVQNTSNHAEGPEHGQRKREMFSKSLKILTAEDMDMVEDMEARVEKVLFSPTESRRKKIKVLHESLGTSLGLLKSLMDPEAEQGAGNPQGPPSYERIVKTWRNPYVRKDVEGGKEHSNSLRRMAAEQSSPNRRSSESLFTDSSEERKVKQFHRLSGGGSNRMSGSEQEPNMNREGMSRREIARAEAQNSGRRREAEERSWKAEAARRKTRKSAGEGNEVILVDGGTRSSYLLDRTLSDSQYV
uniref:Potassium channel domain-containing protein n=1 Tax=Hanusia phi TaxID=3032 RepID=A0A7S0HC17_9CRYP|mmetsp:Transcript_15296/g.35073  ORF Transcript_15296/g.35073 Transcript_15296/m.35073 type:complete len:726 (+) Transcript_15296:195-2372(+)